VLPFDFGEVAESEDSVLVVEDVDEVGAGALVDEDGVVDGDKGEEGVFFNSAKAGDSKPAKKSISGSLLVFPRAATLAAAAALRLGACGSAKKASISSVSD